jgi:hypothetical protein
MKYIHNNSPLPSGSSFTIGDERFGSNWLARATPEMLTERGITIAPAPPPRPSESEKFYYITKDGDGYVVTPKPLDGLKRMMTANANRAAHSMLAQSDYMVVKQTETGVGVLPQWTDYRAAVREESNRQCGQIEEATSVDSLAAITANWPRNPDELADELAEEARRDAEIEAAKLENEGV